MITEADHAFVRALRDLDPSSSVDALAARDDAELVAGWKFVSRARRAFEALAGEVLRLRSLLERVKDQRRAYEAERDEAETVLRQYVEAVVGQKERGKCPLCARTHGIHTDACPVAKVLGPRGTGKARARPPSIEESVGGTLTEAQLRKLLGEG